MVKIENAETKLAKKDGFLNYADLIIACLNSPVEGGFSFEDIEKRLRIKAIADCGDRESELEFEDSDFAELKKLVQKMRWGVIEQDIVDFSKKIINKN